MAMVSLDEALATVDRVLAGRVVETETLPVAEAHGRFLAEAQTSRVNLPPFDKSAMDGYAVMANDERDTYRVLELVPAGQVPKHALAPGTAAKVMTGAPVPEGAGRVIMVEDTDGGDETVRVSCHHKKSNICKQAEDVRVGQTIMAAGTKLDAVAIANLVACGIALVAVRRRIAVAIYATGDEIVDSFEALGPGKIMDSNSPMLCALAREQNLDIVVRDRVSDDPAGLTSAIEQAAGRADVILLSGGVSAGDFDFVPEALEAAGFTIHVDAVAVKPGKPVTFAVRDDCVALGMPGNPVSVLVSFHMYVRRIVALLSGADPAPRSYPVALSRDLTRKRSGRAGLVPCVINEAGLAELLPYHGSAHLLALCAADGFLEIPQGVAHVPARETVQFHPWTLG